MSDQATVPGITSDGSQIDGVSTGYLQPDQPLPLVIQPAGDQLDLPTWAAAHRDYLASQLEHHGGILFRGFDVQSPEAFEQVIVAITGDRPLQYTERSSPRTEVSSNIYTSTDYPPDQHILLHNEHSYNNTFPLKIFFFALTPAQQGGETPIADTRKIYERIDPAIRERFRKQGYMYVRNFGDGFGLPWQEAFQTTDKAKVEEYCRNAKIQVEWKDNNRLRTRQIRQTVAQHPKTGALTWFNHATLFNVSTLPQIARDALLSMFKPDDVPNNTFYADGTPIEPEVLDHLRMSYQQELVSFPWLKGDVLMLDNMLASHGRAPYSGPRKILVGMAEPCNWDDVTPAS